MVLQRVVPASCCVSLVVRLFWEPMLVHMTRNKATFGKCLCHVTAGDSHDFDVIRGIKGIKRRNQGRKRERKWIWRWVFLYEQKAPFRTLGWYLNCLIAVDQDDYGTAAQVNSRKHQLEALDDVQPAKIAAVNLDYSTLSSSSKHTSR